MRTSSDTPVRHRSSPGPAAGRRGTSAVEFAVILPTLVLIVLATIDLSRMAHASYVVSNALRAGADHAATRNVTPYTRTEWETGIRAAVQDHLQRSLGPPAASVVVDITTASVGDDVTETTLEATLPLDATADWPVFGGTYVVVERLQFRQFR